MKTKIQAGAELDLLNKDELKEVMKTVSKDWFSQVSRGDRYPRFSASATTASNAFGIDGSQHLYQRLGPAEGFVWAVQRLAVHNLDAADRAKVAVYLNDSGPSSLVHPAMSGGYIDFSQSQLVMYPGDTLLVAAVGLAAADGTVVTVTGQARELPMPLAWRIGG